MIADVRCFLLDLGKVLVDIDLGRLARAMQTLTGLGALPLQTAFTGDGLVNRYESGRITDQEFHFEFCSRIGRQIPWEEFAAAWNSIFLPGQILGDDILHSLAKRGDLWVISNTNPIHFRYIQENYGLLRHFRGFILSHEVGALKPDPAIFEAAAVRTGFERAATLFVDDQLSHVETARKLGFQALQFTSPSVLDPVLDQ
jgi:glucose-1-phosphatase